MDDTTRKKETRTYAITAAPKILERFEKFLSLLHYNSHWGHSATFGMWLDGDGNERFHVADLPSTHRDNVNLIGGVGYDLEIPCDDGFTGRFLDSSKHSRWVAVDGKLLKDGVVVKEALRVESGTFTSRDEQHAKEMGHE